MASEHAPVKLPEQFDVAISFAGPERKYASQLADLVKKASFEVFYDDYYPAQLWGEDLASLFDEIYRKRARYCVIFKSAEYIQHIWTTHERRSAVARAVTEKGKAYLLPIEVEDVELPGVPPTVAHVSLQRYSIEQIADLLIAKLRASRAEQDPERAGGERLRNAPAVDSPIEALGRYLIDPYQNRIQIHSLIMAEVEKVLPWICDHMTVPPGPQQPQYFVDTIPEFAQVTSDLTTVFALSCHWGGDEQFASWREALTRVINTSKGQVPYLRNAGFAPLLVAALMYSGGIGAVIGRRYGALASLFASQGTDQNGERFSLAWSIGETHVAFDRLLPHTERWQRHYQPFSEQVYELIRGSLAPITADDNTYDDAFDYVEYLLALLYADAELQGDRGRASWVPGGRFIWRHRHNLQHGVEAQIQREIAREGSAWGPLAAGLFDGSLDRVQQAQQAAAPIFLTYRNNLH